MHFACWITKATDTHSEYVILIAFTRQQWLHERASMFRLYVRCYYVVVLGMRIIFYTQSVHVCTTFLHTNFHVRGSDGS
jgi:hypothetical protein